MNNQRSKRIKRELQLKEMKMSKEDIKLRNALTGFMTLVLQELHPNLDEYPLEECARIDESEGDESPKWIEIPEHIAHAYYMQKAINTLQNLQILRFESP